MYVPQLGEKTCKVLSVVLDQAMDGYMLQSKTGLNNQDLSDALRYLKGLELVSAEGDISPETIRSAYVWVPPGTKGNAQFTLRSFLSGQAKAI